MKLTTNTLVLLTISFMLIACGKSKKAEQVADANIIDIKDDIGIGIIKSVEIPSTIDSKLATSGKSLFEAKCTACHKLGKRFVGPNLDGVTKRRQPEWIMNMILDPVKMISENENAKKLMMKFNGAPMANQSLKEDQARSILEFFRSRDSK